MIRAESVLAAALALLQAGCAVGNLHAHHDVQVPVAYSGVEALAVARLEGRDDLGGSFWNPPAHARDAVRDAFASKLEWLLGHPAVAAAPTGPRGPFRARPRRLAKVASSQ